MTAGRGFIAIAIVVLGRWRPLGVLLAALLFGAANALQFAFQAMGLAVPYQLFLVMLCLLRLAALGGAGGAGVWGEDDGGAGIHRDRDRGAGPVAAAGRAARGAALRRGECAAVRVPGDGPRGSLPALPGDAVPAGPGGAGGGGGSGAGAGRASRY